MSAEPAADFDAAPVRPSRSVFDAAEAATGDVTFFGATCDKALPEAVLDALAVLGLEMVFEAAFAAEVEVVFAAADWARAANVFFSTIPLLERAVAPCIREAAMGVILDCGLAGGFVAISFFLLIDI